MWDLGTLKKLNNEAADRELEEEECDHSDRDTHCCLICGKDLGEDDAAAAEWAADASEDR
jgi:hypothetical protein